MKKWCTEIKALEASTDEMKTWCGEHVEAPTWELAQKWCDNNKGYLKVIGELIAEIPCKEGTYKPDWDNITDYETIKNN